MHLSNIFTLALCLLLFAPSQILVAQHCQYDYKGLIGVRPLGQDKQLVDKLKITLLDKWGQPVIEKREVYKKHNHYSEFIPVDTVRFWRNPKPNKDLGHRNRNERHRHFVQAGIDYILITDRRDINATDCYLKIEDIDGQAHGGHYATEIIPLTRQSVQSLCGYPRGAFDDYHPLIIDLKLQQPENPNLIVRKAKGFRFELDLSPLVACPECEGCVCKYLKVYDPLERLVFEQVFVGNSLQNDVDNVADILVADYNFDGYADFQLFNSGTAYQAYYLYDAQQNTFKLENLLSQLNYMTFDPDKKTARGTVFGAQPPFVNAPKYSGGSCIFAYEFEGDYLRNVRIIATPWLNPWNGPYEQELLRAEPDTSFYIYLKGELIAKPLEVKQRQTVSLTKRVKAFEFVLEKNYPTQIPAEKGAYANRISVYREETGELLFASTLIGNSLREAADCKDSLAVADYNFDGFPDMRFCNSQIPTRHDYFVYNPQIQTFEQEKTLSRLHELEFDFAKKSATGHTDNRNRPGYPMNDSYPYEVDYYSFEGEKLQKLRIKTLIPGSPHQSEREYVYLAQQPVLVNDSAAIRSALSLRPKNLKKTVGPFTFQVEFNPHNLPTSQEAGSYARILRISQGDKVLLATQLYGNHLRELPHWKDSLEIADFNFDGYPDLRIYNSAEGRKYLYYLYDSEQGQFFNESYLSAMQEAEFYPQQQLLKGKIIEPTQTTYLTLRKDTLTFVKQKHGTAERPFVEEYLYRNGNRRTLRTAYVQLESQLKREYGDYNFDGHEDFRQSVKGKDSYEVYLYNPETSAFEKDSLLSKFEIFTYEPLEMKLSGQTRQYLDELSEERTFYAWSIAERKMLPRSRTLCHSKTRFSEQKNCIVSEFIDGKWVDTEFIQGAE